MKYYFTFLIVVFVLQSCENKKPLEKPTEIITPKADSITNTDSTEVNDEPDEDDIVYPKTGRNAAEFIPESDIYTIQYETKGDLNEDGLEDITIVLKNKEVKQAPRPMLILLQNKDKSYRLDKVSNIVMPREYNEYDYQLFDTEEITIEKGELSIKLYGKDNAFATFKYSANALLLTSIEGFYRGAGAQNGIKQDFVKGEEIITEIDLISSIDEPKVVETKDKIKKERHLFENTSIINFFN